MIVILVSTKQKEIEDSPDNQVVATEIMVQGRCFQSYNEFK